MNFAMSASLVKVVFVKLRGGVKHSYSCAHYYVLPLSFHLQVWMLRFLTKCSDTQLHCLVCKSVQNMHCTVNYSPERRPFWRTGTGRKREGTCHYQRNGKNSHHAFSAGRHQLQMG